MRIHKATFAVMCALVLVGASAASAQEQNGWFTGQSGLSFGGQSSWLVGAETGHRFGPVVGVYGTFGRMTDTTPKGLRQVVDAVAGANGINLSVASPTWFGVGGLKVYGRRAGLKPYGLVGLGVARVTPVVKQGTVDLTDDFESAIGTETSDSGRVIEFGGGVELGGPLLIDIGYRFMHLGEAYDVSRFYGAVGVRF
jgi:hypothetical protein